MAFNNTIFLVWFLPVFIAFYLLCSKQLRNVYLLIISLVFYMWAEPFFVGVLLFTTCLDFYLVQIMHNTQGRIVKKVLVSISILINVGLLIYFKYYNFFVESINHLFTQLGIEKFASITVLLPLGISFYTFETITYVVDVYRGEHEPQKKLNNYLLYIFFFPKMIAGPIVKYREIADQLTMRNETMDDRLNGFYRFCIGLAKKVLIANQLATYGVDYIFARDPSLLNGSEAWIGIIGYSLQIYFDFSAYTDMAIGLGRMVGFNLPENFDSPFLSSSITEFWRRWHITLGSWMKNYLYIPMGGNKMGKARMYFNLWLVFLISGLWHKASWTFVLWGAFHGFIMVVEKLWLLKILRRIPVVLSIGFTFLCVNIGFVLFRTDDIVRAYKYYKALLFSYHSNSLEVRSEFWLPFTIALLFSFINYFNLGKKIQQFFYADLSKMNRHVLLTVVSMVLFFLSLSFNTRVGFNPFIYFRF